jgi:hypothetical protein
MPKLEFSEQQIQQLTNMLANTREWPWVVTNPLLVAITQQMQPPPKESPFLPSKGNSDKYDRRLPD